MLEQVKTEETKCRFCDIWNDKRNFAIIDEPFAKDANFFAISSIGALVEGWTLIVPKNHTFSLKDAYSTPEFGKFFHRIVEALSEKFGRLIAFEHGANLHGSLTSCGTDHAHLHIVPLMHSLNADLKQSGLSWQTCELGKIGDRVGSQEYLFYADLNSPTNGSLLEGSLHILESPRSQFFRRILADKIGKPECYDYRLHPFLENAKKTSLLLADVLAMKSAV